MIFIDTRRLTPTKEWLEKSEKLLKLLEEKSDNKDERDKIIDKTSSQNHWKALKGDLKQLSFGKCWYSEAKEIYSHYHVDHFRPKKSTIDDTNGERQKRDGYWWLTFKHTNYCLAGSVGNTIKSDHFAVKANCATCPEDPIEDELHYLLDPTKRDDPKKLRINVDGKMVPACPNKDHWDYKRADYTIQKLELNWPDLKDERAAVWSKTQTLIDEIEILDEKFQTQVSVRNEEKLIAKLNDVRKMIAPCAELSSTARACLKASRKDWAIELLSDDFDYSEICVDNSLPKDNNVE
jgi:uncharacterized protein (TIGR02646 family)